MCRATCLALLMTIGLISVATRGEDAKPAGTQGSVFQNAAGSGAFIGRFLVGRAI